MDSLKVMQAIKTERRLISESMFEEVMVSDDLLEVYPGYSCIYFGAHRFPQVKFYTDAQPLTDSMSPPTRRRSSLSLLQKYLASPEVKPSLTTDGLSSSNINGVGSSSPPAEGGDPITSSIKDFLSKNSTLMHLISSAPTSPNQASPSPSKPRAIYFRLDESAGPLFRFPNDAVVERFPMTRHGSRMLTVTFQSSRLDTYGDQPSKIFFSIDCSCEGLVDGLCQWTKDILVQPCAMEVMSKFTTLGAISYKECAFPFKPPSALAGENMIKVTRGSHSSTLTESPEPTAEPSPQTGNALPAKRGKKKTLAEKIKAEPLVVETGSSTNAMTNVEATPEASKLSKTTGKSASSKAQNKETTAASVTAKPIIPPKFAPIKKRKYMSASYSSVPGTASIESGVSSANTSTAVSRAKSNEDLLSANSTKDDNQSSK